MTDYIYYVQCFFFGGICSQRFNKFWLCNLLTLSVADEVYSRNASYAVNYISSFLFCYLLSAHIVY